MAHTAEEESAAPGAAEITAAAVTTDAEGDATAAVGSVGSNSLVAAADQVAVVTADFDGGTWR
jgi:hypothetical protein